MRLQTKIFFCEWNGLHYFHCFIVWRKYDMGSHTYHQGIFIQVLLSAEIKKKNNQMSNHFIGVHTHTHTHTYLYKPRVKAQIFRKIKNLSIEWQ